MVALNKEEYINAASLFADTTNSKPVVFSVIEGNTDGNIIVDEAVNPQTALIYFEDFFFLKGKTNKDFCKEIYSLLTEKIFPSVSYEYFDFYCLSDNLRNDVEKIFALSIHGKPVRKTFTFDYTLFKQHLNWRIKIPEGFTMDISTEKISATLKKQSEIISECSAVFIGGNQTEISIETNEKYRRRGFATLTCSAFIELCTSCGYTPNWTCWDFREGSAELAKKLGFVELSNEVVYGIKK
jgi:RimJ/RimL family protein N-acetyltransferase